MTSLQIIILISITLAMITIFSIIANSIEKNRKAKQMALSQNQRRASHYANLLDHFPSDHLSAGMRVHLLQRLLTAQEQLCLLDNSSANKDNQQHTREILQQAMTLENKPVDYKMMASPAQISNTKEIMKALNSFVNKLHQDKKIDQAQLDGYQQELKQLAVQCNIDTYLLAAKQEEGQQRDSVALHYYQSAAEKIIQARMESAFVKPYHIIQAKIDQLAPEVAEQKAAQAATLQSGEDDMPNKDAWKKKQVYD